MLRNTEKAPIKSPTCPQKIPPQVARPGYPLAAPSVLILTQPGEGKKHKYSLILSDFFFLKYTISRLAL